MDLKLGKLPATPKKSDFLFESFTESPSLSIRQAPVGFGHYQLVSNWGMLGNDYYGDCVLAGADHETMMWNAIAGKNVPFTDDNALSDYGAITGFNKNDPNSDQGTNVHDALDYRRATGVVDANTARHKIGAYVSLEPGNWAQVMEALYIFDVVAIGFLFPDYADAEFMQGRGWTYRGPGNIIGGHYVPIVGRPHIDTVDVITWSKVQPMSKRFYLAFCDEAYGIVSEESLVNGRTAENYRLTDLYAAVKRFS